MADFDLDAAIAEVQNDFDSEPFTFDFGGETWTAANPSDARAGMWIAAGKSEKALRQMLGDAEYTRLFDHDELLPGFAVGRLLGSWMRHGTDEAVGEDSASPDS